MKKYGVRFSGHGSKFAPEIIEYNLTLEEAELIKLEWETRADTIGGAVEIEREL